MSDEKKLHHIEVKRPIDNGTLTISADLIASDEDVEKFEELLARVYIDRTPEGGSVVQIPYNNAIKLCMAKVEYK